MVFEKGKLFSVIKKTDCTISNVTKAVIMFLDDSRAHNPIAKSNPVAKID